MAIGATMSIFNNLFLGHRLICLLISFGIINCLIWGCGRISEKKNIQMIQNSTDLMNTFRKNSPLPELFDDDLSNGGIMFAWNDEGWNDNLYVDVIGIKDETKIKLITDKVVELAKQLNIENKIYLRLYKKYMSNGGITSDDKYNEKLIK